MQVRRCHLLWQMNMLTNVMRVSYLKNVRFDICRVRLLWACLFDRVEQAFGFDIIIGVLREMTLLEDSYMTRKNRAKMKKRKADVLTLEQYIAMLKSSSHGWESEIKRLEERLAFQRLSPEEKEAELQRYREADARLTEWPSVPNSYIDSWGVFVISAVI